MELRHFTPKWLQYNESVYITCIAFIHIRRGDDWISNKIYIKFIKTKILHFKILQDFLIELKYFNNISNQIQAWKYTRYF